MQGRAFGRFLEERHFLGSNPGRTSLRCGNRNFSRNVQIIAGCMRMICLIERFFKNSSGADIQAPLVAEGPEIEAGLARGFERLTQLWRNGERS